MFPEELPLQPLRIPTGWLIAYNNGLYEIDPDPAKVPESERWWIFKEDMVQMKHEQRNRLLDIGWYLEGNLVDGYYNLFIHEGNCSGPELHRFRTRDRLALVAEIERLLKVIDAGKL